MDKTYRKWISELKNKVRSAQIKAAIAINKELILFYWDLGQMISEKLLESNWGDGVLKNVVNDLKDEFPKMGGLSERNLKYCRQFYQFYTSHLKRQQLVAQREGSEDKDVLLGQQAVAQLENTDNKNIIILQQLVAQIPWGHNILIFTKSEDVDIASFYIRQTIGNQWSRAALKDQIKRGLHKRKGKATSNFSTTLSQSMSTLAQETIKDPYVFDFLTLDIAYREKDIENQLIHHINKFLLELGKGFAYVGQQYQITVSENDYYLDLLFYHMRLKCYVVIELKNTKFQPEFTGKLNFYLSAVDSLVKADDDNPTIGLLLCKEKNSIEAEFALRDIQKPIGVSEYVLTKELPDDLKSSLPTIEEIENQLNFEDEDKK